jgi:cell filamentation protein
MSPTRWRWEERDYGFRFRTGRGRRAVEHYQAAEETEFYIVPERQSKLPARRRDELSAMSTSPPTPVVVAMPWRNYELGWDHIYTDDGIVFNFAGCLDQEEIDRREDEGVARAMEYVAGLVDRDEPVPLSVSLVQRVHVELMGAIYPFAGDWRTVNLTKGDGPTKWPLPPVGIAPLMEDLENRVFSRSPFISDENERVYAYVSEVMNELLAIHPFREGNGRTAFIVGSLILMQNNLPPLNRYDRDVDEYRYYKACEAGRIGTDYSPLTALISEWEERELDRWNNQDGNK